MSHLTVFATPRLSRHAQSRMQQRGIARAAIDRVLDFGREHHDRHGAVIVLFDRAAAKRLLRTGTIRGAELDALRGLYAVIAHDGSIRTVGHRTRRLWNN